MCSLNISVNIDLANVDVRYWKACIAGDIYEDANADIDSVQAFEFAQHRGVDFQQLLASWDSSVAQ